jgi:hypothetical protein
MWYYVPVDDGWEEVLGCNVYITSQYLSPNAKYWTASSGNRTRAPPDRMWTLYNWAMEYVHNMGVLTSQYFSPNAKYWTASSGIEPGTPPERMWTLYHWAIESVHNMGVLMSQYFSPNAKYWTASSGNQTRDPPDRMWPLYHWAMESVHNMGVLVTTQQHTRTPNNRQQHTTTVHNSTGVHKITNVPLFKKLWDTFFFVGQ